MRQDGKIDYIEFPGTDLPATKAFYAAAFGWTFTDYGPSYAAFEGEGTDGGFDADPDGGRDKAIVVLYAHHLETMEAKVVASGGIVTREIRSFPGGRRFHFRDPSGNELAVWSDT